MNPPLIPIFSQMNPDNTLSPDVLRCLLIYSHLHVGRGRGSSVSIVSDYGPDDREIGVRSPAGAKDFSSSLCVQTGSGAHLASCTMGTGGPFPRAKCGRGVTLTTHSHLVPRSGMSRSSTPLPPSAFVACSGTALLLLHVGAWSVSFTTKILMPF
jgi:hypothetical protein